MVRRGGERGAIETSHASKFPTKTSNIVSGASNGLLCSSNGLEAGYEIDRYNPKMKDSIKCFPSK